jgi:GTPase SAR1 family protein
MIRLIKHKKPDLPICHMNCDKILHEKLEKYELTKFLNKHSTNLFIGKPSSGKTSLLYSFFKKPLRKVFHHIYIFQPSNSRFSMEDKIFDKLPEDQLYEELTVENLQDVINKIKVTEPDENSCIIFDDMTAYLKNPENIKILKELIFNRRHLHTSIYFLCQTWFSIPKDIRKLFSNVFIFRVSIEELKTITEEILEQQKEYIIQLSKLVYDKPHNYLFINTDTQRLFKNFDEIIIDT